MRLSPKTLDLIDLTNFIEAVYNRFVENFDSIGNPIHFIAETVKEKSESEAEYFKFSLALCSTVEKLRNSNIYVSVFSHFLDGAYGSQSLSLLTQLASISKKIAQLDLLNLAGFYSESNQRAQNMLLTLDQSIYMISQLDIVETELKEKYLQILGILFRRNAGIDPFKVLEELLFV